MKVFTYRPGSGPDLSATLPAAIPLDALADRLFEFETLDEALQVLQREGATDRDGKTIFTGVRGLLEAAQRKRRELAGGEGQLSAGAEQAVQDFLEGLHVAGDHKTGRAGSPNPDAAMGGARRLHEALQRDGATLLKQQQEQYEALEKQLQRLRWGFDPHSIDEALLDQLLGPAALEQLHLIRSLPRALVERGYAQPSSQGLRLTQLGMQRIARRMLQQIFRPRKRDRRSPHSRHSQSTEPFLVAGTRPFQFGDHLQVDTSRSIMNALRRAPGEPVRLQEQDFEVYEKEPLRRTATAVLLDISKSMRFERRIATAKKIAFTLDGMVRARYPQDRVIVIGFSTAARVLSRDEIPFLAWDEINPYTNVDEAFLVAGQALACCKGYHKQIFLITDGEPTAHREHGKLFFQFPPHPATLAKTLQGIDRLVRQHISLSIFLLAREEENISFMKQMARRSGGRLFHLNPADLGRCLMLDFEEKKQRWL